MPKGGREPLPFSPEEEAQDEPFGAEFAGDQHNQKESYDLNYAIRRLLMQGLPRGEENKDLRQMVYDEKNLLLRDGVDRPAGGGTIGADSRQAKPSLARAAYMKTQAWADRGGSRVNGIQSGEWMAQPDKCNGAVTYIHRSIQNEK